MKTARSLSLSAIALAGLACSAAGQITIEGPFTGAQSEGFTTQVTPNPFPVCVADRVFTNTADLCAPSGSAHITGGWGFECSIGSNLTPRLFASTGGAAVFTFDDPVARFGGFFGTNFNNNVSSGGSATFFDAGGAQIGSVQTINIDSCGTYRWNGWSSTVPVKKIEVLGLGSGSGGGYIMMDDLEYDRGTGPVPCYANCDASTVAPILNVSDFICFQTKFAANDPYANCDNSTVAPVLNVSDFICFQTKFSAGCS
jgi:hypothetical protein